MVAALGALVLAPSPAVPQIDTLRRWLGFEQAQGEWTGDLDGMLERRQIRLLVVPSRTFYFVDEGTQRGISYDLGQALEKELNEKRKPSASGWTSSTSRPARTS